MTETGGPRTVLATNPTGDLYGSSRMFLASVEAFLGRGWRVVVALPGSGPLADEVIARGGEVRVTPSPVLRRTFLSPRGLLQLVVTTLRWMPAAVRLLRSTRPDVLYVNTVTEPLWVVAGRCARVPVVGHVHEAESTMSRPLQLVLTAPLLLARRRIANSRFTASVLTAALPRLEGRCDVVLNGIEAPSPPPPSRPDLAQRPRLLYLGRLSERKGVHDAVDAVQLLHQRGMAASLDIVGDVFPGYEPVEAALRDQVTRQGLDDAVRFHGFAPDVWPHLAANDVLLVPSRLDESFGNVAVEGLLAARPVIVAGTSGLREAVEGFGAVLTVPPAAPGALADAVEQVVYRWDELRAAAVRDSEVAASRHAPARYRDRVAAVVAAAIARGSGSCTAVPESGA